MELISLSHDKYVVYVWNNVTLTMCQFSIGLLYEIN